MGVTVAVMRFVDAADVAVVAAVSGAAAVGANHAVVYAVDFDFARYFVYWWPSYVASASVAHRCAGQRSAVQPVVVAAPRAVDAGAHPAAATIDCDTPTRVATFRVPVMLVVVAVARCHYYCPLIADLWGSDDRVVNLLVVV